MKRRKEEIKTVRGNGESGFDSEALDVWIGGVNVMDIGGEGIVISQYLVILHWYIEKNKY